MLPISASLRRQLATCILGTSGMCVLSVIAQLPFAKTQDAPQQFLAVVGLVFFGLATLISMLFAWSERKVLSLLAVIPLLICLGSCAVSTAAERAVRRAEFERQLPRYQQLVDRIRRETALDMGKVTSVTLEETDMDIRRSVLAELDTNGVLTVELLTGCGFPLKHSGYLYSSSGRITPGSFFDARWPLKAMVKTNWFHIYD